jgi:hypothetical protein
MEIDNKKARDNARREYNDTIRVLIPSHSVQFPINADLPFSR